MSRQSVSGAKLQKVSDFANYSPVYTLDNGKEGFVYQQEKDVGRYTVLTEVRGGKETFNDFYTNRKTSLSARKTRSEEARDIDNSDVSGAKLQKVSDFANYSPVYYSNAEKAVEGISQNKATAEQWLAMIQKQGGLKAGEDKWLGLRDWLTARKGQSLTKEKLLDYIRENQVHVDEVSYTANPQGFEDLKREYDGEDLTLPKKEADKALQKLLANGHKVAFYGDEYKPKYDEHGNLIEQNTDPQPIDKGMFGNIYDQFKGKAKEAIAFLLQKKEGEATGALHHKDIGDIDLVWGEEGTGKSDGFGLAKLVKYHPEVLDNLQNILDDMHVVQRSDNRVRLESASHQAAVRLTWDNQKKNWLLTAFEKKNSAPDNTTDTAETLKEGERNDTATPQNTVSIGKDTDKSSSVQENGGKNAETRETALRDGLIDKLRSADIEVITDEEEAQRVLDAANGDVALSRGQKRAVETVSVSSNEEHQQTVISTADNAKVLNNLDNLAKKLDNLTQTPVKTFLGEVAKALGAEQYGSGSQYATFETKNGQIVTIRLADHNAHTSGFDYSGKDNGISIVISAKKNSGINNDGNAHIVEYYYDAIKLRRANGKPLADIVRAIQQSLYSGEFKDPTGLAEREEVNVSSTANEVKFLRTDSGEVYGFTKDGKIYIDPRKATAETPVHEFTHLWADGLRKANPKAWERLKGELEKEKDLFDYVKSLYPELSGDDLIDEVFAHFSGRRGAERLRSEQEKMMQKANGIFDKAKITTMFDRLRNILHDFWAQARDLFAGKTEGIERLSAEDFADMALADLIKGEKPLVEGKKEVRYNKAAGLDVRTYDNSNQQTRDEERVTLGELVSGDRQLRERFGDEEGYNTGEEATDFHTVIDEIFDNADFDKSVHQRERYDLGKTPTWMKRIGIAGDRFSLSFKNIKTHKGKDADHDLTREEWHQLPDALKNPFAVTRYNDANDRFRLYVNVMHNGNYVAVGVDVKCVNQGRNLPMMEVNTIKTVFAHHGEIGGGEKLITYDKEITPKQEALLRGLNFREYPTIQELSAAKITNNSQMRSIESKKVDEKNYLYREQDESEDVYDAGRRSLEETLTQGLIDLSEKNRSDVGLRISAMKAISSNLSELRSAMSRQRDYDKSTVK